jgi:catechol 2,3-dioxygenase-like lactoylglutathione lyase family enzyme
MNAVPVLYSRDLRRSLAFYTSVLDFTPRYPEYYDLALQNGVFDVIRDGAVIQLSIHMGRNPSASSVNLELDTPAEVDALFAYYTARGLEQSSLTESPVHVAPLDQTWGTREVYINDPDGNCLCLRAWRSSLEES